MSSRLVTAFPHSFRPGVSFSEEHSPVDVGIINEHAVENAAHLFRNLGDSSSVFTKVSDKDGQCCHRNQPINNSLEYILCYSYVQ